MPIEIRELVIRAVVEQPPQAAGGGGGGFDDEQRARLIQQCVDEVLRKLRRERER